MLTYEGAGAEMLHPYFSHRWKPLQPLTMYGRWAKMKPEVRVEGPILEPMVVDMEKRAVSPIVSAVCLS